MAVDIPKAAIATILAGISGIPVSRVIWSGDAEPNIGPINGKAGKLTLDVVSRASNGTEELRYFSVGDPDAPDGLGLEIGAWRVVTVSVRADNFFGHGEAFDLLERVRLRLKRPAVKQAFRDAGCPYVDSPTIIPLEYVVDNRSVSSATLDMRLQQLVTDIEGDDDPVLAPWIEKVSSHHPDPEDIPAAPIVDLEFTRDS